MVEFPFWPFKTKSAGLFSRGRYLKKLKAFWHSYFIHTPQLGRDSMQKLRSRGHKGTSPTLLSTAQPVVTDLCIETKLWRAEILEEIL
jgi:hypothetical protein